MSQKPVMKGPHLHKAPEENVPMDEILQVQRINRVLSLAGLASRREADKLIESGRVEVNGEVIRKKGCRALWGSDSIKVDGREIPKPFQRAYIMLNKPFGYISALRDPAGRPVVSDLLTGLSYRVYPVGRLDFDTLGLLLFTNDGQWAHRLTHPKYRVPRTYKATVEGKISQDSLEALKTGIRLYDGLATASKVTLLQKDEKMGVIRLTIAVGRSRVVRRMFEAKGYRVIHLIRIGFGRLELGGLKVGQYRHLEPQEVRSMKKTVGMI